MDKRTFLKTGALSALGLGLVPQGVLSLSRFKSHQEIPVTDTHLHLWDLSKMDYPWLKDAGAPLERNFLLPDYHRAIKGTPVSKMVFVECARLPEQYLQEVDWVTEQAQRDKRIKGMVAYFPLEKGKESQKDLETLTERKIVRGIRKGVSSELMADSGFCKAVKMLSGLELSYDLNISAPLMKDALDFVKKFPDLLFVLDHVGNPDIKGGQFTEWAKYMSAFSELDNVTCKISGMITKADPRNDRVDDLLPYFDHVMTSFGTNRVIYGGDWPVVLRAGSYHKWISTFLKLCKNLSIDEKRKLYYLNAERIYRI
ncbi:amidohydrolase family protein [Negadavirga shengliensis]|uniref:Amidohydrolase family protein n=1 Tax=Negadavirga shengliensis TaxID=1389218 RepID=A0ABV9T552_9BACT